MKIWRIKAPEWTADAFSEDERERKLSELQYDAWVHFYMKLLPQVRGLEWRTESGLQYIFSRDTIEGGYRLSVFDNKGAISHSARDTIEELFKYENFPNDGSWLSAVA